MAMENLLKFLMRKILYINVFFFPVRRLTTRGYQIRPVLTPNKSSKTPKQTAERKPNVCDGDLNLGQHSQRVRQDGRMT